MDLQDIIAYGLVVLAAAFLVKKYLLPKKKASGCGGDDCKCH